MIEGTFFYYKDDYEELENYTIRLEKTSYIFHKIFLESDENLIQLNLDDYGNSVSVLFYKKRENFYYYALADYSHIKGAKEVFDFLPSIDKKSYYWKIKSCLKLRHVKNSFFEDKYVKLIYSLVEAYLRYVS